RNRLTSICSSASRVTSSSRTLPILVSIRGRDPADFFERGHALADLVEARAAQGVHAQANRLLLELGGRRALQDQILERVLEQHDLVERDAALVAGVRAGLATLALHRLALLGL